LLALVKQSFTVVVDELQLGFGLAAAREKLENPAEFSLLSLLSLLLLLLLLLLLMMLLLLLLSDPGKRKNHRLRRGSKRITSTRTGCRYSNSAGR